MIGAAIGDGRIADHAAKPMVANAITTAAAAALLHRRARSTATSRSPPPQRRRPGHRPRRLFPDARRRCPGAVGSWFLSEAAAQQTTNAQRRGQRQRGPVGVALENGRDASEVVRPDEGAAGEHFVEDAAERPDVGAFVDRLAARLLRTHVGGRAENQAACVSSPAGDRRRLRESASVRAPTAFASPKSSTFTLPSA